jgi:hypothetical protein
MKSSLGIPETTLRSIAGKLGVAFTTVQKAANADKKNWRNCEVRGVRLRDAIRRELKADN